MTNSIQMTVAQEHDIPELCALLTLLFSQEAEFTPHLAAQTKGLLAIIQNPSIGFILVAKEHGQTIGMVNILFSISTALGARVAILEDMIIASDYRAKGVGSMLISHAIAQARQHGCKRITLLTDASNLSAQQFYQKQGFTHSDMLPMRLMLD